MVNGKATFFVMIIVDGLGELSSLSPRAEAITILF